VSGKTIADKMWKCEECDNVENEGWSGETIDDKMWKCENVEMWSRLFVTASRGMII